MTIGLVPLAEGTFCDLIPERPARVFVTALDGSAESVQDVVCRSCGLAEPGGVPYAVTFDAPREPGEWIVRVEWEGDARSAGALRLAVRSGLGTTLDHPVGAFELREVERPPEVHSLSRWPLTVRLRNDGTNVWLASSDCEIPPDCGVVAWTLRYTEVRPLEDHARVIEFLLAPEDHHHVLPHDVAPGDDVVCRVSMRTPRRAGEYAMEIGVGALGVSDPREWGTVALAPLSVH